MAPRTATVVALVLLALAGVAVAPAAGDAAPVAVQNQSTDGTEVTVADASLADGGFLVVSRDGERLGASGYLAAGNHSDVVVPLDDCTFASGEMTVTAYEDADGDRELDGDDRPYRRDGAAANDTATLTVATLAPVTFNDQRSDGEAVTVARVADPCFGVDFVAVHGEGLLDGEWNASRRGVARVRANATTGIEVSLSAPFETDAEAFAVLYTDSNGNGEFDPSDAPVENANGDAALDGARLSVPTPTPPPTLTTTPTPDPDSTATPTASRTATTGTAASGFGPVAVVAAATALAVARRA